MVAFFLSLPVVLALHMTDETVSGFTGGQSFRLVELDGQGFAASATLSFPEEGRVQGQGPCNSFSAVQTVPYPWIDIGPVIATRRACPELPDETRYFAALEQMTLAEALGDTLILRDESGREMVFHAVEE